MIQHQSEEKTPTYRTVDKGKQRNKGLYEVAANTAADASSARAILCLRRSAISARFSAMSTDARSSH